MTIDERRAQVRDVRARLAREGPVWTRPHERDFETVTLPALDSDLVRDLLIGEQVQTVVEIGLAYASSALAIGEALVTVAAPEPRHVIIDPFQESAYCDVGWELLRSAGLAPTVRLLRDPSSIALPGLLTEGFTADAAFVDGSHRFHEVFLDFYYLRKIVRPGGLIVIDDADKPPVRAAARYYELNLGWTEVPDAFLGGTAAGAATRCLAFRLPGAVVEPPFKEFRPF